MISADYHMHTEFDHDGSGKTEEFVRASIQKGMSHICFTMHCPCPKKIVSFIRQKGESVEDMDAYVKTVADLKKQFKKIKIGLGIEIEYAEGYEAEISEFINEYDFDYVLGSVHLIGGWMFDYSEEKFTEGLKKTGINDACKNYYKLVRKMTKLDIDAAAHFDLIKKFNYDSKFFSQESADYKEEVEKTLDAMEKKGLVLEVNTAGLYKPVKEIYPSQFVLKKCFERKIELTIGSDSHSPEQIGRGFDEAERLLRKIGFKKLAIFKKRKKGYVSL